MRFYVSVPFDLLEERIGFVLREGFIPEIRMASTQYLMSLTDARISGAGRILREVEGPIFSHGPFFGLDVASIDEGISKYSIACLERAVEVTAMLGGALMVMHTGYLPQYSRIGRHQWFGNWSRRMPRLIAAARSRGVTLALENTWDDRPEVLTHLRELLPGGPVAFCLDTGHMNVYSRLPVARWWRELGSNVAALHLHDNDGLSDDHLPPGRGTFDFEGLAGLLGAGAVLPLLDLEVDYGAAGEGREYLAGLFARHGVGTPRRARPAGSGAGSPPKEIPARRISLGRGGRDAGADHARRGGGGGA